MSTTSSRCLSRSLLFVALLVFEAQSKAANLAYVYSSTQQFGIVNLDTGVFQSIGTITDTLLSDITSEPGQPIYGIDAFTPTGVVRIDRTTLHTTFLGAAGIDLLGLELSPAGNLYGQSGTSLYSLNKGNGAAALIGAFGTSPGFQFIEGAFAGTQLYAVGSEPGALGTSLFRVDTSTGFATFVGENGYFVDSIVYVGGQIYGFTADPGGLVAGPLVTIDPSTGLATIVASQDASLSPVLGAGVYGAGSTAVPEPNVAFLSGGGLLLLCGFSVLSRKTRATDCELTSVNAGSDS